MKYKIEILNNNLWLELMFNLNKSEADEYIKEYRSFFTSDQFRIVKG